MIQNRTETIQLPDSKVLSGLCHISKNLYNETNYLIRQAFFNGEWIRYKELASELKTSENYKIINSQSGQQLIRVLDCNWKAYIGAKKEYDKNPDKFLGEPRIPKYKPKNGENSLTFTNQQMKIKNGFLIFPKNLNIKSVKTRLGDETNLREVRIIPKSVGYTCEIVYQIESESLNLDKSRIISLDYGVANIVTIADNFGGIPMVIKDDGTGVKSINQFYNKQKSGLQSIYDKQKVCYSKKMRKLIRKRNNKMKDTLHKMSKFIIDDCVARNVGKITIGHNDNWKQNVNLGKRNNQNFVGIPFYKLTQMIQYKAEALGIEVVLQNESHTSKVSFLDYESIEHHKTYVGKRYGRLFKSATGIIINSDVQGCYNISQKCELKAFEKVERVGGCVLHPVSVNPLEKSHMKRSNIL